MGQLPDMLPGYAPVTDANSRRKFAALWGATLPEKPGMDARGMLAAAAKGQLHALYAVGANPVKNFGVSAKERLGKLDLLIVQDRSSPRLQNSLTLSCQRPPRTRKTEP